MSNARRSKSRPSSRKTASLSGSVLRCVNSAYYGLAQSISSIRQAVTLLGFGTVRNLALAFSMKRMVRPPNRRFEFLCALFPARAGMRRDDRVPGALRTVR